MNSYVRPLLGLLLVAVGACYAQGSQAPATVDELQYLRFLLMSVASLDHHPDSIKQFEGGLVKQFGMNTQESAAIHAAAQELNGLLQQLRQSSRAILPGKSGLSPAQSAALSALATQREQKIEQLANRVLNQVRPQIALRLRAPGQLIGPKLRQTGH